MPCPTQDDHHPDCLFCQHMAKPMGRSIRERMAVLDVMGHFLCRQCGQFWAKHLLAHPHRSGPGALACTGIDEPPGPPHDLIVAPAVQQQQEGQG